MVYKEYLNRLQSLIDKVEESQGETLISVAKRCADAIAADRWVHLFGAGHSAIPVMEIFPRIGSFVGFHPLLELNLSYNGQVVGGMAQRQASFLERVEGYADVILANHSFTAEDVLILYSHSGINELIVDMAHLGKEKGMTVVGVTSVQHSARNEARHSSGLRLYEAVDFVLDTCVPEGDALVNIDGLDYPVGGSSTIMSCVISVALLTQIAGELAERSYEPVIWPSHNINTTPEAYARMAEQEERVLTEYWNRLKG